MWKLFSPSRKWGYQDVQDVQESNSTNNPSIQYETHPYPTRNNGHFHSLSSIALNAFFLAAATILFGGVYHTYYHQPTTTTTSRGANIDLQNQVKVTNSEAPDLLITTTTSTTQMIQQPKEPTATTNDDDEDEEFDPSKETYAERLARCASVDWEEACDRLPGNAGARRRRHRRRRQMMVNTPNDQDDERSFLEETLLRDKDDPSVVYDADCMRVYRLDLFENATFPYHANHILRAGGNQTMALFIQHGALRDANHYFCSFRKLMQRQNYRNFDDILIISPDFNYKHDEGVMVEKDAFWNSTKPWGDWRVGAESDPECCGNTTTTLSSFDVLDQMLALLTDTNLYPNMDKISYVGHSAGGQMVQRYAIMSRLASYYDLEHPMEVEFIIANPSSYTYLDNRRYQYSCGDCDCTPDNCTCHGKCTFPSSPRLAIPHHLASTASKSSTLAMTGDNHDQKWVCYTPKYNHWPYGIELESFSDGRHAIPYVQRRVTNDLPEIIKTYGNLHVVYMVGQNDTCNDGLVSCHEDCWQLDQGCFRNHMDTRCPAMLEGPFRRRRGLAYMDYLQHHIYHRPSVHRLHVIPGVGHNATAMFASDIGVTELFNH